MDQRIRSYKDYSQLTFTDDFMFCKVMSSNPDLCRRVTETVLGRKISRIGNITIQNAVSPDADSKGVRFDVFFEDEEGTQYDIEMQTASEGILPKRIRYYQGLMDLDSLDKGADYDQLKKTCIVFICLFDVFGQGLPQYTFKEQCQECPDLYLNDGTEKVFFCATPKTVNHSENKEQEAFLGYLLGRSSKIEIVSDLDQAIEIAKRREAWRKEYMTLSEIKAKEFKEGIKEGIKQGIKEGVKQGIKKGVKQGIKEGQHQGRNSMLRGMLSSFKRNQISFETAFQLVSSNPECQTMGLEEIRNIWDQLG